MGGPIRAGLLIVNSSLYFDVNVTCRMFVQPRQPAWYTWLISSSPSSCIFMRYSVSQGDSVQRYRWIRSSSHLSLYTLMSIYVWVKWLLARWLRMQRLNLLSWWHLAAFWWNWHILHHLHQLWHTTPGWKKKGRLAASRLSRNNVTSFVREGSWQTHHNSH